MLVEIKNWKSNKVIFSYDCKYNTIKKTVEEAVKRGVKLRYANLSGADLSGANLYRANLNNANLINADLSFVDIIDEVDY